MDPFFLHRGDSSVAKLIERDGVAVGERHGPYFFFWIFSFGDGQPREGGNGLFWLEMWLGMGRSAQDKFGRVCMLVGAAAAENAFLVIGCCCRRGARTDAHRRLLYFYEDSIDDRC